MNTKGTFLLYEESDTSVTTYTVGTSSTKWAILYPITEYPDVTTSRGTNDATTLSDQQKIYEFALPDMGDSGMEFPGYLQDLNDPERFEKFKDQILHVALSFGGTDQDDGVTVLPTGGTIMRDFNAYVDFHLTGAGVDEVRPESITLLPTPKAATYPTGA